MLSHSNDKPLTFEKVGNGSWYYNYDIHTNEVKEGDTDETRQEYEFQRVQVWGNIDDDKLKKAVIKDKYDESEEINLQNNYQRYVLGLSTDESYKTDYIAYLKEIDTLKTMVDADLKDHADELKQ